MSLPGTDLMSDLFFKRNARAATGIRFSYQDRSELAIGQYRPGRAPWRSLAYEASSRAGEHERAYRSAQFPDLRQRQGSAPGGSSEERRVGKEGVSKCRSRGSPYHYKKKKK